MKKDKAMSHRQAVCAAVSDPVNWQDLQASAPRDTCWPAVDVISAACQLGAHLNRCKQLLPLPFQSLLS